MSGASNQSAMFNFDYRDFIASAAHQNSSRKKMITNFVTQPFISQGATTGEFILMSKHSEPSKRPICKRACVQVFAPFATICICSFQTTCETLRNVALSISIGATASRSAAIDTVRSGTPIFPFFPSPFVHFDES